MYITLECNLEDVVVVYTYVLWRREREKELKLKLIDKLATGRVTRNIYVYVVYTYLPHYIHTCSRTVLYNASYDCTY